MKLIDNAKDWRKFWSIRLAALWSAAIATWPVLSDEQRTDILVFLGVSPDQLAGVAGLVMFLSISGARLVKQS